MTNLQKIRKDKGITQAELAQAAGVNVKMVQKYEQGIKDVNHAQAQTVIKLALALKCNILDLLEGDLHDERNIIKKGE